MTVLIISYKLTDSLKVSENAEKNLITPTSTPLKCRFEYVHLVKNNKFIRITCMFQKTQETGIRQY